MNLKHTFQSIHSPNNKVTIKSNSLAITNNVGICQKQDKFLISNIAMTLGTITTLHGNHELLVDEVHRKVKSIFQQQSRNELHISQDLK